VTGGRRTPRAPRGPGAARRHGRLRHAVVGAAAAGALVLSGCAPSGTADFSPRVGAALQEAVHAVASASAQGRYDAASVALDEVRAVLDAAVELGEISVARYREVDSAILRTAAELDDLASAAVADEAEPDEGEPEGDVSAGEPEEEESAGDGPAPATGDVSSPRAPTSSPSPSRSTPSPSSTTPSPSSTTPSPSSTTPQSSPTEDSRGSGGPPPDSPSQERTGETGRPADPGRSGQDNPGQGKGRDR
jgi:hypothetical protein